MTKDRRLSPATLGRLRVCFSLFTIAAVLVPVLSGCGGKPKPTASGYYDGPIKAKGSPAKNNAAAPGQ